MSTSICRPVIGAVAGAAGGDRHELAEAFSDHHHHHLVCTSCGRVEDFDGCGADRLARQALRRCRAFKSVQEHSIELFGLCYDCA